MIAGDLLKHYVRVYGMADLISTYPTRRQRPYVRSYFTFSTAEALDVFTLIENGLLSASTTGNEMMFCEKEDVTANQLEGMFPDSIVLRGRFENILPVDLAATPERGVGESETIMTPERTRRADEATMKRALIGKSPFDVINLDLSNALLNPSGGLYDSRIMLSVAEMLRIQHDTRSPGLFLSITTRLTRQPDPGALQGLRDAAKEVGLAVDPGANVIAEQAQLLPLWYRAEVVKLAFAIHSERAYRYRRREGGDGDGEYEIFTWMARLNNLSHRVIPSAGQLRAFAEVVSVSALPIVVVDSVVDDVREELSSHLRSVEELSKARRAQRAR